MGLSEPARVDVAALLDAAVRYEIAAERIDSAVRTQLNALRFDGALAGREYVAHGNALRSAVDEMVEQLRQWSRAAAEISVALRASAHRFAESEARAAQGIRVL